MAIPRKAGRVGGARGIDEPRLRRNAAARTRDEDLGVGLRLDDLGRLEVDSSALPQPDPVPTTQEQLAAITVKKVLPLPTTADVSDADALRNLETRVALLVTAVQATGLKV